MLLGQIPAVYFYTRSLMLTIIYAAYLLVMLSFRIPEEEQILAKNFSTEYPQYSRERWRLVPFIY